MEQRDRIASVLRQEEERFGETLENGMRILEGELARAADPKNGGGTLDGKVAFTLYDTYGFPFDLTADICRERGVEVDMAGFEAAMEVQRTQARAAGRFKASGGLDYAGDRTTFTGYEASHEKATIGAIYVAGTSVPSVREGDEAVIVLDRTPFYAESGGQVGDAGQLSNASARFEVTDTQKVQPEVFGHHGRVTHGELKVGDRVDAAIDAVRRAATVRNHSATHLMHKALREVLGTHVAQRGSLVDADKTRFDFSHNAPLSADEIRRVEEIVNKEVLANVATRVNVLPYDEAVKKGAMALFGEKYGDVVRTLEIGTSHELCGGTHVARTGDIGLFKIVSEGGVAAGVRRIEAVTGENALKLVQQLDARVHEAASALKSQPDEVVGRIAQILDHVKSLERELGRLKSKLASSAGDDLASQAIDVSGKSGEARVLATQLDGADVKALRETMDRLKSKLKTAVIVLSSVDAGRVSLIAGVTPDLVGQVKAGELVNYVAQQVGGKGGGRPDTAQAGGTDPSRLGDALASVRGFVEERL